MAGILYKKDPPIKKKSALDFSNLVLPSYAETPGTTMAATPERETITARLTREGHEDIKKTQVEGAKKSGVSYTPETYSSPDNFHTEKDTKDINVHAGDGSVGRAVIPSDYDDNVALYEEALADKNTTITKLVNLAARANIDIDTPALYKERGVVPEKDGNGNPIYEEATSLDIGIGKDPRGLGIYNKKLGGKQVIVTSGSSLPNLLPGQNKSLDTSVNWLNNWMSSPATVQRQSNIEGRDASANIQRVQSNIANIPKKSLGNFDAIPADPYTGFSGETRSGLYITNHNQNNPGIWTHELFHAGGLGSQEDVEKTMFGILSKHGVQNNTLPGYSTENNSEELYARMMQARRVMGVTPGQKVTPEMLQQAKEAVKDPADKSAIEDLYKSIGEDATIELLNTMAANKPRKSNGVNSAYTRTARKGGVLYKIK